VNLAIALQQAGDFTEAENALRRALSVNDRHPVAHNELGIVLRRLGRFEEARQSYERALEIHPGFHFALRNRGIVCELFLRDETCAIESYRAYLEASPGDDEVGLWVALLEARSSTEEGG
jgi:Flp pilus assembly protein TadD